MPETEHNNESASHYEDLNELINRLTSVDSEVELDDAIVEVENRISSVTDLEQLARVYSVVHKSASSEVNAFLKHNAAHLRADRQLKLKAVLKVLERLNDLSKSEK